MRIISSAAILVLQFYLNQYTVAFQLRSPQKQAFKQKVIKTSSSSSTTNLSATWSNGQSIQEYQDYLAGVNQGPGEDTDIPSVIITNDATNNNKYVNAIINLGGGEDTIISPNDEIPETFKGRESFPIYILLSPIELDTALRQHFDRYMAKIDDFVFITWNHECIEQVLKQFSLPRDKTSQLLPTISLPDPPYIPQDMAIQMDLDQYGEPKWAMESLACGKWKHVIAARLDQNAIHCNTVFYRDYRRSMWEKIIFYAVFNLIGAVRDEPTTFADVAKFYGDEASDMAWQLSTMLRGSLTITLSYGFEGRMFTWAQRNGADIPCVLNEENFQFCNGCIWDITKKGLSLGFGDPAPLHTEYIIYAIKKKGMLQGLELPYVTMDQKPSIMRQGNLRADGDI